MGNDGTSIWCAPRHVYDSAEAAAGKVMEVKEVMVIDLTATFGAGNEPDKETCDKIFANWFDGTKSTISAMRVKAVGKNLLKDGEFYDSKYTWEQGFLKQSKSTIVENTTKILRANQLESYAGAGQVVRVKKGENITLSAIKRSNNEVRLRITEVGTIQEAFAAPSGIGQRRNISRLLSSVGVRRSVTLTSVTTDYVVVTVDGHSISSPETLEVEDLMLEYGTTATPYEPYRESTAYINGVGELRSVPVANDEVNISTGVKTQRTKEKILEANDISKYWTNYQTHDWISMLKPTDYKYYGLDTYNSTLIYGSVNILSELFVETGKHDTVSPNPKIGVLFNNTATGWGLMVPKGTFSNVDEARAALAGTKLIYQLATPIEIPAQVTGTLVGYPSGTVYLEPYVPDAGIYDGGISVLHQDLPIKSLERISKIDYETGLETELDISKVVIATDKLSFTHPDLKNGDIVFFIYEYDRESTTGEMTVEYYDSRYIVKDSMTGKFYKWNITVANGVPSIQLTEV